jgi:hypothetical protein
MKKEKKVFFFYKLKKKKHPQPPRGGPGSPGRGAHMHPAGRGPRLPAAGIGLPARPGLWPGGGPDSARPGRASQPCGAPQGWRPPLHAVADFAFEVAILPPHFLF